MRAFFVHQENSAYIIRLQLLKKGKRCTYQRKDLYVLL